MNYENLISIVMPVFNAQAYLEEALESVRRQTWTDWELLVVDDHSTDGSAGQKSAEKTREFGFFPRRTG